MSDQQPKQAKITSFFAKPAVQRTLTTGLVPDRKRKLDDTELEKHDITPTNKKQKIQAAPSETQQSIDDALIAHKTVLGSSKSSGNSELSEKQLSPPPSTKPTLSKYLQC